MPSRKVLILAKEGHEIHDIESTLQQLGYVSAGIALSIEEALQKISGEHPNLILAEVLQTSTQENLASIRKIYNQHKLPIVYLLDQSDSAITRQIQTYGVACCHIAKPFSSRELNLAIEFALYKEQVKSYQYAKQKELADIMFALDAHTIVTITDAEGVITYANRSFCELSEYAEEELCGSTHQIVRSVYHPPEFFEEIWKTISSGDVWKGEICNQAKSGRVYWVDTIIVPFLDQDNKPFKYIFIRFNITKLKNSEESLKRSVSHYQMLAELSSDFIYSYVVSETGERFPVWITSSFERITGYNIVDFYLGEQHFLETVVHPEDLQLVQIHVEIVSRLLQEEECEFRIIKKNGDVLWVLNRLQPQISETESGKVIRIFGATNDISSRVKFERGLKDARREAEEANRYKSEFIANMSHELRTPLNSIIGFSKLLSEDITSDEERLQFAGYIYKSGSHLLDLINEILDLSKLEAQMMTLDYSSFMLNYLIRDCVKLVQVQLGQKKLSISLQIDATENLTVKSDQKRLRQSFFNLLSNASKFTPDGGTIWVTTLRRGQKFQIYVKDNGIGIESKYLELIFDKFTQVDSGLSRASQQGTGLGLSITRKIIEVLQGSIFVSSEIGVGSTFVITLPVTDEFKEEESPELYKVDDPESVAAPRFIYPDKLKQKKILVMEIPSSGGELMHSYFHLNGQEHHSARSIAEALPILEKEDIDLIVLDTNVACSGDVEAVKSLCRIRQNNIIAVSSNVMSGAADYFFKIGYDAYLPKPVDFLKLVTLMLKLLFDENRSRNNRNV